jgi:deferrochelatase/peroxidase EfeB
MSMPFSEFHDVQGLLRSGYNNLTEARYLLLRIIDSASASAWLAEAPVTTAAERCVSNLLQVALTADGMRALGVSEQVIAGFSPEFQSGIAGQEWRSRRLGDVGASAPSRWRWGAHPVPDVLIMLAAETGLSTWRGRVLTDRFRRGFEILEELHTSDMHNKEPFGFTDGISQPQPDWDRRRRPGGSADLQYGNLIALGEFLLGYRNEFGQYTDRPLLDAGLDGADGLPLAEDDPSRRDLGRNGSYLVFRELHQDVRAFWRFVTEQAGSVGEVTSLAEVMVGRRMSGEPLIPGTRRIRGVRERNRDIRQNGFIYDDDPRGVVCPIGAHVRRANPRTGDMPPGGRRSWFAQIDRSLNFWRSDLRDDLVSSSRFHRILRRGREFGEYLTQHQAARPDAHDPRSGIHFVCLNANISRQFEFIQNAWVMNSKFAGLSGEGDPLLGDREPLLSGQPTDAFGLPQPNGTVCRLAGMPQFVTVAGGAYFFLPGMRALRYLAGTTLHSTAQVPVGGLHASDDGPVEAGP